MLKTLFHSSHDDIENVSSKYIEPMFSNIYLNNLHSRYEMISDFRLGEATGRSDNEILSLKFHPEEQILLASDVAGCVHFGLFDLEDTKSCSLAEGMDKKLFQPHKGESCRAIDLIPSSEEGGYSIVTGGADGRVAISSFDPKVISKYKFENAINVVKTVGNNMVIAGDDEGAIFGIDVRTKKKVFSIHEQEDYISSITFGQSESPLKSVVCTSGDCTLGVYDMRSISDDKKRKDRLVAMSDQQEDELNCAVVLNSEQNLCTGDANGVIGIWKQGYWGDLKDRIPLYGKSETPQGGMDGSHSIEGMKAIGDKEMLVVTSDGVVRVVSIFPNQVDRILGVHRSADDSEIATISGFDCDVDLALVATTAGDSEGRIKFWSLKNTQVDHKHIHKTSADKASRQSFFSDL
jgi:WD40 repeat protein